MSFTGCEHDVLIDQLRSTVSRIAEEVWDTTAFVLPGAYMRLFIDARLGEGGKRR
jgi:hypothetical protein